MNRPTVAIQKGRAKPFWFGCPVVFSGSIATVSGNPGPGDVVNVRDDSGALIGWGFFNPASSYSVRIVARQGEPDNPDELIRARILSAAALRRRAGLPGPSNDMFRLVNSEGDGLSGLTVDLFGAVAVVMESAYWTSAFRRTVEKAVREAVPSVTTVLFRVAGSVRNQEGMTASDEGVLSVDFVTVLENGLSWQVRPGCGQKTGYYADQRENRLALHDWARNATVLDLFCFSGGFAINAAAAGASAVTAVDSSAPAIASGKANAGINGLSNAIDFIESDVFEFLESSSAGQWDVVVCDPPKLAAGRTSLDAAVKRYVRLNSMALRAVKPGGLLVTCSCSSAVRRDRFLEIVRDASGLCGSAVTVLETRGPGCDHPVSPSWPEGEYLKVAFVARRS